MPLIKIVGLRVVQKRPPWWAKVLTLGVIRYWKHWTVQGEIQAENGYKSWFFSSPPAPAAPNPLAVAQATVDAINLRMEDVERFYQHKERGSNEQT